MIDVIGTDFIVMNRSVLGKHARMPPALEAQQTQSLAISAQAAVS
jgi:hypothetical protein